MRIFSCKGDYKGENFQCFLTVFNPEKISDLSEDLGLKKRDQRVFLTFIDNEYEERIDLNEKGIYWDLDSIVFDVDLNQLFDEIISEIYPLLKGLEDEDEEGEGEKFIYDDLIISNSQIIFDDVLMTDKI